MQKLLALFLSLFPLFVQAQISNVFVFGVTSAGEGELLETHVVDSANTQDEIASVKAIARGKRGFCKRDFLQSSSCDPAFSSVINVDFSNFASGYINFQPSLKDSKFEGLSFNRERATKNYYQERTKETAYCDCLENIFRSEHGDHFEEELAKAQKIANEKVLTNFGKKFINDFTSHLEDVTFYLNQSGALFKKNEEAASLQCHDFSRYANRVNQVCGKEVSEDERKRRSALFLDALSPGASKDKSFQSRMEEIAKDALQLNIPQELQQKGNGSIYLRSQFDQVRHGLTRTTRPVLMDKILAKILQRTDIKDEIILYSSSGTMRQPRTHFVKELENLVQKNDFLDDFVDVDDPMYPKLKAWFEEASPEKRKEAIRKSFAELLGLHPGVFQAFTDVDAFKRLAEDIEKNKSDKTLIMERLETRPEILKPSIVQGCAKLIESFAQAVCTPEEEITKKISADELYRLVKGDKADNGENNLSEILTCGVKSVRSSPFNGISGMLESAEYRPRKSDYYNRLSGTESVFEKQMKAGLENKDSIEVAAKNSNKFSRSVDSPNILSRQADAEAVLSGGAFSVTGRPVMSKRKAERFLSSAKTESSENSTGNWASNSSREVEKVTSNFSNNNSVAEQATPLPPQLPAQSPLPQVNHSMAPVSSASENTSLRKEFVQQMSAKHSSEEIEELTSKIADQELEELRKLKGEADLKILELRYQQEEFKLKELQERLTEMQDHEKSSLKSVSVPQAKQVHQEKRNDQKNSSERGPARASPGIAPAHLENSYAPAVANMAPTSNSYSSAVLSSQRAGTAPSGSGGAAAMKGTTSQKQGALGTRTSSGAIVINTSIKRNQELSNSDVSSQVISLIENGSVDPKQLSEIKNKGMVLRYQVLEENEYQEKEVVVDFSKLSPEARELIESRVSMEDGLELNKQVNSQRAKLALLKMIINEHR